MSIKKFLDSKILLWYLPILSGIGLLILSYISIDKIENMKTKADKIYFGNFIQVSYLYQVQNLLNENIINYSLKKYKNIKNNNKKINRLWNYYKNTYKTKKEREAIKKVDKKIRLSMVNKTFRNYTQAIKYIKKIIKYEMGTANINRKKFLIEYRNSKQKLYIIIAITIGFVLASILIIILRTHKEYNKLEFSNKKYKIEAITDGMTKLYNKKYFNDMLDNHIREYATKNNVFIAFVMFDIDNFKKYNDTYGHDMGDDALIAVANVLKKVLNKNNCFLFRLGGEEFGGLIIDISKTQLDKILNILNIQVQRLNIEHSKNPPSNLLTISIGATLIAPNDKRTPRDIYVSADKMLYRAKESGRNCYFID